jgi:hypothetical protein
MKKNLWVMAAALVLVLGAAGYTIAQSTGSTAQAGPGWMMGPGAGIMGGGTAGWGMMNMMFGRPLSPEQLDQFAKQHGITIEQAQQMTQACTQIMAGKAAPQTPGQ